MKKRIVFQISLGLITIVLLTTFVLALSTLGECKKGCSTERRTAYKICNDNYKIQRIVCNDEKKECLNNVSEEYSECKESCDLLNKSEVRDCRRNCTIQKNLERKNCSKTDCLKDSREEKNLCREEVKNNYTLCQGSCTNIQTEMSLNECNQSGGFYHPVCNGPYFDVICSPESYCLCEGDENYQCPEGYSCKNAKKYLPRKQHTVTGYTDLLGNSLGDIGVCTLN